MGARRSGVGFPRQTTAAKWRLPSNPCLVAAVARLQDEAHLQVIQGLL